MVQKVDRASIKAQAKQQLKGKVWMTFLCIFVAGLISGAAGSIPSRLMSVGGSGFLSSLGWVVYIALLIFVSLPISVGLNKVFLNITYGYQPSVATLFEPFGHYYKNSVLTPLYVSLIEFVWYLPFMIVSIIVGAGVVVGYVISNGESILYDFDKLFDFEMMDPGLWMSYFGDFLGMLTGIYLVVLLLMIPYTIIINAYAQSIFVLCEYPGTTATGCVEASKAMMKGRRWELFVLNLSFIPWYLLVAVTFGIAAIYVTPYVSVTLTNYYHRIKDGYVGVNAYNNGGYGTGAGFGQPGYGQPVQPGYGQSVQPAADQYGQPVQPQDQPVSESQQAIDQASHDMMTNFDDYIDKTDSNE